MAMTFVDYTSAILAKREILEAEQTVQFDVQMGFFKAHSEVVRRSTELIVRVQVDKKGQSKINMLKLMPFSWDKGKGEQTSDQMRQTLKMIARGTKGRERKKTKKIIRTRTKKDGS